MCDLVLQFLSESTLFTAFSGELAAVNCKIGVLSDAPDCTLLRAFLWTVDSDLSL
jgi:hypothetical protein